MTGVSIPNEAVEAAARALVNTKTLTSKTWDELSDVQRTLWLKRAEATLNAAAPLIVAAELERIAEGLRVHTTLKMPGVSDRAGRFAQTAVDDVRAELCDRAAELRAQT